MFDIYSVRCAREVMSYLVENINWSSRWFFGVKSEEGELMLEILSSFAE
jgi:hypothetical protein